MPELGFYTRAEIWGGLAGVILALCSLASAGCIAVSFVMALIKEFEGECRPDLDHSQELRGCKR